jgi:hypothetical protein
MEQLDDTRAVITDTLVARCLDHVFEYYGLCMQSKPLEEFVPLNKRGERQRRERQATEREQKEREEKEKKE